MTRYFFDTSALVKRYHPESGTKAVLEIFSEPGSIVQVSRLALVECISAFGLKVRSGHLAPDRLAVLRKFLWSDTRQRVFLVTRLAMDFNGIRAVP